MDNIALTKRVTSSEDPLFKYTDPQQWARDVAIDVKEKANYTMDKNQIKTLESALNYRITQAFDENFEGQIFNEYNGIWEVLFTNGDVYYIQISSEPSHVLRRTTGRAGYSCEEMDNDAWLGPFHDIALMNPTAYLLDEEGHFLGRLNVRWARTPKGQIVIGVDPNVYPFSRFTHTNQKNSRPDNLFKEALYYILQKNMRYEDARTPYKYKGHSDTTAVYPDVTLPYKGYDKLMYELKSVYAPVDDDDDFIYFDDYWDIY